MKNPSIYDLVRILRGGFIKELLFKKKKEEKTRLVHVGEEIIGGEKIAMMAGPCAVESEAQIMQIAKSVKETGATFLRGGAYKARTSPYDFSGLGLEGLKLLRQAGDEYNLKIVSEITSERQIDEFVKYCDMAQVGARNMQNFELLKALGRAKSPVLLKRAPCATIEEWLYAAEYVLSEGNSDVVLCERGIRTFESQTSAFTYVEHPDACDGSTTTGRCVLAFKMGIAEISRVSLSLAALAALAAGAGFNC